MSMILLITILVIGLSVESYLTQHYILCGVLMTVAVVLGLMAMAFEGSLINRIKKLEEQLNEKETEHHAESES